MIAKFLRAPRQGLTLAIMVPFGLIASFAFMVWPDTNFSAGLIAASIIVLWIGMLLHHRVLTTRNARAHEIEVQRIKAQRIKALAEAEHKARMARDAATSATATKTSLVANMSHEIRTPMNGIIGFAQLLLSTKLTAEQRKYAELIVESGGSMVALLNDILDLAKIDAGKMQIHPVQTNVRGLLASAISMMRAAARRKNLDIRVEIAGEVPRELMLDGLRVKQVLSNLIGNAIKFTEQGEISISLRVIKAGAHESLEFKVCDTGIGIAPECQSAVFEQFVQSDVSSQRAHGGSGLGLPISRKIAQLMQGTLALESQEGRGTQVSFCIPMIGLSSQCSPA